MSEVEKGGQVLTLNFGRDWIRQEVHGALFKAVEKSCLRAVVGDVAEFGTFTGLSAQILASGLAYVEQAYGGKLAAMGNILGKNLHLFDSFQGLPESTTPADTESPHYISGLWKRGAFNAQGSTEGMTPGTALKDTFIPVVPERLTEMCASIIPRDKIHIHPGWFRDTVPQLDKAAKFAVIHIDCDLYSSTMDALEPLISRDQIARGASILFDDWNCNQAAPEFGERKAWADLVEKYRVNYSPEQSYGAFGHSLIFHGACR